MLVPDDVEMLSWYLFASVLRVLDLPELFLLRSRGNRVSSGPGGWRRADLLLSSNGMRLGTRPTDPGFIPVHTHVHICTEEGPGDVSTHTCTHTLGGSEPQLPTRTFEPLPGRYPVWVAGPHALQGEGSPFLRRSGPLCGPGPQAPSVLYWPGCVVSNSKLQENGWAAPGKPRPLSREVRRGPVGLLKWNSTSTWAWAGRRGSPGPRAPASTLLLRFPTGEHRSPGWGTAASDGGPGGGKRPPGLPPGTSAPRAGSGHAWALHGWKRPSARGAASCSPVRGAGRDPEVHRCCLRPGGDTDPELQCTHLLPEAEAAPLSALCTSSSRLRIL
ncbi:collagen alpha-4(IV) chain-like [Delphinapterus leucas]|uniref:Collagen alpha-4(IV) chain-like n=1 Tax=Delphinapterus leucas TaxID=9749 RepID=A0A7F8K6H4_DELLE|nr:collagen alpha-4(IV) chain-like [Delphinapterus leucas]